MLTQALALIEDNKMLNAILFHTLHPQLSDPKFGAEPDLYTLLVKYYAAGDFPLEQAKVLAHNYIAEWVKLAEETR